MSSLAQKVDTSKFDFVTIQKVKTEANANNMGITYELANNVKVRLRTDSQKLYFEKSEDGGTTWSTYWTK